MYNSLNFTPKPPKRAIHPVVTSIFILVLLLHIPLGIFKAGTRSRPGRGGFGPGFGVGDGMDTRKRISRIR